MKTFELNIEVKTAGAGTLVLTAPDTNKAPQLDKLDIQLIRTASEADLTELTATIAEAEKILNAEDKDKYSATALEDLQKMVNAGKAFTENTSQTDVDAKKPKSKQRLLISRHSLQSQQQQVKAERLHRKPQQQFIRETSKVFTINPDKGYHIESITVDGENVETIATEYAFEDIVANHTVEVTFAKDELTIAKENLLATINTANKKLAETEQYTPSSLKDLEDAVSPDTQVVIIDARAINNIDITAADRLAELSSRLTDLGIHFYITEHTEKLTSKCVKLGVEHLIREGHVRRTILAALHDADIYAPYELDIPDSEKESVKLNLTFFLQKMKIHWRNLHGLMVIR